ncbi:MAG: pilin [Candidatus Magasanikbacteria bacterium]|nr:pilin [Candidatus Magasanikbacteria bacterium]
MKKISKLLSRKFLTLFGASAILFAPVLVLADDYGLSKTASAAGLAGNSDLTALVGNIIGSALSLVGVVFFILMVYGGFLWMTARGKEDIVNKAKDTIIAAVIGLIIVFASYALTSFIFSSLDGRVGGGGGNINNLPFADEFCVENSDCSSGETCIDSLCVLGTSPNGVCKSIIRTETPITEAEKVCTDRGEIYNKYRCETTQPCVIGRDDCKTYIGAEYSCLAK